jgi:uncharacterized pyridoxamine 5'-phosphate oxidase family protein
MKEIIDFLQESKMFFLATAEADQPRVRPMGFVMEYNGKLCFCTNNTKKMFAQMKANPKIEICASCGPKWLRITGTVAFCPEKTAKEKALEISPRLRNVYKADDGIFEIFYFEQAKAVFADMQGGGKEITI